ncbi:hypothetical protein ACFU9X_41225 [Streptomyces atratus]|uniref:hypothetical protein n=1 Tax=Streptomyces atratus TaxID=1893 RepID=UPI00367D53F1
MEQRTGVVPPTPGVRLGLRENRARFTLLVIVTASVGSLVGLERTTVPLIGTDVFGLTSYLAVFSFIVAFGLAKALTNLAAGALRPVSGAGNSSWQGGSSVCRCPSSWRGARPGGGSWPRTSCWASTRA